MAERQRHISILPLLLVNFIGSLGFSIVLPSLVYLVKSFKGNDFLYGALGATFSTFQLFGAPFLGKLSDRYGRRKILFLSELGSTISWILFIAALYLPVTTLFAGASALTGPIVVTLPLALIFIARIVEGWTGGNESVANAYLADITTPAERKKDFGKMGMASSLGFIFGPMVGGVLGATSLGLVLPIAVALGTSLLALTLIWFVLPESHDTDLKPKPEAKSAMTLREAWQMPGIALILTLCFVFYLAFSLFVASFPLFAIDTMNWSLASMGLFFTFLSVVLVSTQGPMLSYLSRFYSAVTLTIVGSFIVALSYIAITFSTTVSAYTGAALYGIGNGLMWPSFLSLLSDSAGEEQQGYIQGLNGSAGSLASIVGLLSGGILYSKLEGDVFFIAAGLVLIVTILSFRLRRITLPGSRG